MEPSAASTEPINLRPPTGHKPAGHCLRRELPKSSVLLRKCNIAKKSIRLQNVQKSRRRRCCNLSSTSSGQSKKPTGRICSPRRRGENKYRTKGRRRRPPIINHDNGTEENIKKKTIIATKIATKENPISDIQVISKAFSLNDRKITELSLE